MKYGRIAYVDKPVSRVFFGAGAKPVCNGEDCDALLDGIVDTGINAMDTARVYGLSEKTLGDWMRKRGNRGQLVILSKCCHPLRDGTKRVGAEEIREDFSTSCEMLGTDYIDIYLLHRDDPEVPVGDIVRTLNEMHAKGQIGAFGGSNWRYERVREANDYAAKNGLIPFTVTSPNLCLAEQVNDMFGSGCVSLNGTPRQQDREYYRESDMAVVSYSSIGRGLFSGRVKSGEWEKTAEILDQAACRGYICDANRERLYRCEQLAEKKGTTVPVIALAWVFMQEMNTFAIVSTKNAERMKENLKALDIRLTADELRYLNCECGI